MSKYKPYLSYLYLAVFFVVGYRYQPIATVCFAICSRLSGCPWDFNYFMPVKAKLENIAKLKARHGIPLDQPHKVDMILSDGIFPRSLGVASEPEKQEISHTKVNRLFSLKLTLATASNGSISVADSRGSCELR